MSLTFPLDILAEWPGWTPVFELMWRQEQSHQSNGVIRVKDFGEPLWHMRATTKSLSRSELDYWRARLDSLENGINTFKGYSLSRVWPRAYPRGSWPTGASFDGVSAAVLSVGTDNKSLSLSGLPVGYAGSVGDMISITYDSTSHGLLRVAEAFAADVSGHTAEFEVKPHLPVGVAEADVVAVATPYCLMTILPGSIQTPSDDSGRGKVSFEAFEYR